MNVTNETGNTYGCLSAVRRRGSVGGKASWYCRCVCGNAKTVTGDDLRRGVVRSCGCYRDSGDYKATHGHTRGGYSPTYISWSAMRRRCLRPADVGYANYGKRGISVCLEWVNSFENFLADMGERPEGKTLDRKDNDGPYSKENCRWATKQEQAAKRRNVHRFAFAGCTRTLPEWATTLGIKYATLYYRIFVAGWSMDDAFSS